HPEDQGSGGQDDGQQRSAPGQAAAPRTRGVGLGNGWVGLHHAESCGQTETFTASYRARSCAACRYSRVVLPVQRLKARRKLVDSEKPSSSAMSSPFMWVVRTYSTARDERTSSRIAENDVPSACRCRRRLRDVMPSWAAIASMSGNSPGRLSRRW